MATTGHPVDDGEPSAEGRYSIYLVRCRDGSLYTGIATDVPRRLAEHAAGGIKGAKYLRGRGPLRLELMQEIGPLGLALRVERRIKRLSRAGKEALLRADEPLLQLVARVIARAADQPPGERKPHEKGGG